MEQLKRYWVIGMAFMLIALSAGCGGYDLMPLAPTSTPTLAPSATPTQEPSSTPTFTPSLTPVPSDTATPTPTPTVPVTYEGDSETGRYVVHLKDEDWEYTLGTARLKLLYGTYLTTEKRYVSPEEFRTALPWLNGEPTKFTVMMEAAFGRDEFGFGEDMHQIVLYYLADTWNLAAFTNQGGSTQLPFVEATLSDGTVVNSATKDQRICRDSMAGGSQKVSWRWPDDPLSRMNWGYYKIYLVIRADLWVKEITIAKGPPDYYKDKYVVFRAENHDVH